MPLLLIAAAEATNSAASWFPWAAPTISLAAVILAIIALTTSRSEKRHELHLSEILKCMHDLENACTAFAVEVEENLLFRCHGVHEDHTDCHRKATLLYRDASAQLELLEKLIPIAAEKLFHGFKDWHTALTENRYPIQRPEDAIQPGDSTLVAIRNAHRIWNSLLCDVRVGCLSRKTKFWKSLGKPHP
jgi:hypothetical protein